VREDERRAVRRAAGMSVGVAVVFTATTLVGVAVASMVGSGDVPARVGQEYASPDALPSCGRLGDLAVAGGTTVQGPAAAAPGASVPLAVTSTTGEPPAPLAVLVARGADVVAAHPWSGEERATVVLLVGCGPGTGPGTGIGTAGPAAVATGTTVAQTPAAADLQPLPPGDYELVVLFGADLPEGGQPTYAGPALTALRRPLTVVAPNPGQSGA
jgi:hypothetical protein